LIVCVCVEGTRIYVCVCMYVSYVCNTRVLEYMYVCVCMYHTYVIRGY
jgi:hypothetical protein